MKLKRNKKGQFKTKVNPLHLFIYTLLLIWASYTAGLYMDNYRLSAEKNYWLAFEKHIEYKGLEHWNKMFEYSTNRYEQPKQVADIIDFVFQEDAPVMKKIAFCESGMRHDAESKESSAVGVFQVLSYTHGVNKTYLKNPFINTLIAKELFDASGTNPWLSSASCWNK